MRVLVAREQMVAERTRAINALPHCQRIRQGGIRRGSWRERAVRMVSEVRDQHDTKWAAMRAVSSRWRWHHRDGPQVGAPG